MCGHEKRNLKTICAKRKQKAKNGLYNQDTIRGCKNLFEINIVLVLLKKKHFERIRKYL
uniref:Uncharacterized protein n=1 Tax=Octopus bimaculoides TaxID=37653 RepID=A0A0L8GMC2_OCTBM